LGNAKPQACANIVWALGKLAEAGVVGAYNADVFTCALDGLFRQLYDSMPQHLSNALYGCALAGHLQGGVQLLEVVCESPQTMRGATPQAWANSVWAAATMSEAADNAGGTSSNLAEQLLHFGQQLVARMCALLDQAMRGANPQDWANSVWAAAKLRWYDHGLLLQGVKVLVGLPVASINSQNVSNTLLACAVCSHWDSGVQQLLGRVAEMGTTALNGQDLCNNLYAWAVLSCVALEGQGSASSHTAPPWPHVESLLFEEAARRPVTTFTAKNLCQVLAAHQLAQSLGMAGLPEGEVLKAAQAAGWSDGEPTLNRSQHEVAAALQRLGYSTEVEGRSKDGLMSVDVVVTALPDRTPCRIAVEYDGAFHYLTPSDSISKHRLDGPTRLRNTLLRPRFHNGLLCVPWSDWAAMEGQPAAKEEYLRTKMAAVQGQVGRHRCL
jgi:hypothetical protein